ncbi:SDR family oxidoreductase [Paenibacillus sp. HW567]|uniref:SDR family oxidoreductase n=1 Tax=Paenibacillus sp. HW567 TaxID=1034769 RepID=UPI000370AB95|nr:SDR family oxidoreductase [Paenibacillus sp. HW567]
MTILITGATGQLGQLIIEQLVQQVPPEQIIAGMRQLDKGKAFKERGIGLRRVDYDVPESLEEAFAGVSRLLLISSPHTDDAVRITQHTNVVEAAKKAGVAHILYTGFAFPQHGNKAAGNVHAQTEQAILDSGLSYTFVRNALYIDFVGVLGLNEAISSGVLRALPGDWRFNAVTRSDLALATAQILAGSGHEGQIYELAAPKTWTFTELAQALAELAGKPVVHVEDSAAQHWIYNFVSSIDTVSVSEDLQRLMGRPVTALKMSILPFVNPRN